jgi:hypothetical protein
MRTCFKNYSSWVVCTAVAGTLLSACGGGGENNETPTTNTGAGETTLETARALAVPADPCSGLVQDKRDHAMTALAKPAKGHTVVDPQFHTRIRRISGAGGGNVIKPAYSTSPAWNANESYLILYHTGSSVPGGTGHHLYNGHTYQYIKKLPIDPADIEQFYWHASNPDQLMYVDGHNRLIRYSVASGGKTVLRSFSCPDQINGGSDPMYTSWNSDVIGLSCRGKGFSYQLSTNKEGTRIWLPDGLAPIASASGSRFFVGSATATVRDRNMNILRRLAVSGVEHASVGKLSDGTDILASVSFDGIEGSLVISDLTGATGPRVVVGPSTGWPYPPSGTHVSAVALKNPGWVTVSMVGETNGKTVLNQELLLAQADRHGRVCRVAHHRSWGGEGPHGYWAEPHAVISPSGSRILFGSDWGGGSSVDAYVVELPSYAS